MADATQKRILVIDDERDVCAILKVELEKRGFLVAEAYDGSQGMAQTVSFRPDCIILDVRMSPGEDGLTFLRKLRAFREEDPDLERKIRRTPVIVLTAASFQMKPLFQQEGISDYLEKPYDTEVLKERILKVV